jgi:hypothetical protein
MATTLDPGKGSSSVHKNHAMKVHGNGVTAIRMKMATNDLKMGAKPTPEM